MVISKKWKELKYGEEEETPENNNIEETNLKRLWEPEINPLAKFLGPKYAFRPEDFATVSGSSRSGNGNNAANGIIEINASHFEPVRDEEKILSQTIRFQDTVKKTFQRANALESRLYEEENYANEIGSDSDAPISESDTESEDE